MPGLPKKGRPLPALCPTETWTLLSFRDRSRHGVHQSLRSRIEATRVRASVRYTVGVSAWTAWWRDLGQTLKRGHSFSIARVFRPAISNLALRLLTADSRVRGVHALMITRERPHASPAHYRRDRPGKRFWPAASPNSNETNALPCPSVAFHA